MSKSTNRRGIWDTNRRVFMHYKLSEDGDPAVFETDQTKTDTPTLILDTWKYPDYLVQGLVRRIHYRLNPTNAVTYTVRIWSGATANDYASNINMLYESAAAQADDTDYDHSELAIPLFLTIPGNVYYSIDWSGAPGVTSGFIRVEGDVYL